MGDPWECPLRLPHAQSFPVPVGLALARARVYPVPVNDHVTGRDNGAAATVFVRTPGLRELLQQAEKTLNLRRVWLFGSRARGDARDDSDIDLAFEHDSRPEAWADFVNSAIDQAPVLLDLDLVDLGSADPGLRERILREGKLLRG